MIALVAVGVSAVISLDQWINPSLNAPKEYLETHLESSPEEWAQRLAKDVTETLSSADGDGLEEWLTEATRWDVSGPVERNSLSPYILSFDVMARADGLRNGDSERTVIIMNYRAYIDGSGDQPGIISVQPDGDPVLFKRDFGADSGLLMRCGLTRSEC